MHRGTHNWILTILQHACTCTSYIAHVHAHVVLGVDYFDFLYRSLVVLLGQLLDRREELVMRVNHLEDGLERDAKETIISSFMTIKLSSIVFFSFFPFAFHHFGHRFGVQL